MLTYMIKLFNQILIGKMMSKNFRIEQLFYPTLLIWQLDTTIGCKAHMTIANIYNVF